MKLRLFLLASSTFVAVVAGVASDPMVAQVIGDCGDPFQNAYGPFDYRTATPDQKNIVEQHHFTPAVESLRAGITGTVGGELDYTLRAFPNHARALMAMVRLGQRDKTTKPKGAQYTVECFVERAVQFRPDDPSVRQIRGIYLSLQRKYARAVEDFQAAIQQQPNNANAHYNLGLAYFELGNYEQAQEEAKLAQSLGFPLEGLKNKLKTKGKWNE
jgi:tetratricopeptide (TPR) repeat protein